MNPPSRRPGTKFVARLPPRRRIVAMTTHANKVYVATDRHVYVLQGKKLIPLQFAACQ